MATFTQLLTILRRDILGEGTSASAGGFQNADLLNMLYRSAKELSRYIEASEKIDNTATMTSGDTSFTAPTDVADIKTVMIKNRLLDKRPYQFVVRKRQSASGKPRVWNWNARGNNRTVVEIAPAFSGTASAGDVVVEYMPTYDTAAYTAGSTPLDGELPDWHWLIAYRAGIYAWNSVGRPDKAQEATGGLQEGLQALAARIGDTNVLNLLLPHERRGDKGVHDEP